MSAAVLISGGGTNLQAFIDAVGSGDLHLELSVVLSNRGSAGGLERARKAGIPTEYVDHRDYPDRGAFDAALIDRLAPYAVDVVILAGFMRILTPTFIDKFAGRIFNIHPSLLPDYPGLNTHQRALEAGEEWHGSTVHFATEQLDGGPRVLQGRVAVLPNDSPQTLAARVLEIEHRIYPQAVSLFVAGRLRYQDGHAWMDGEKLEQPLELDALNAPLAVPQK
ncbi:MAG: phosphoribosylglycinamide formyltransferase [Woeseiaceae bacterium]